MPNAPDCWCRRTSGGTFREGGSPGSASHAPSGGRRGLTPCQAGSLQCRWTMASRPPFLRHSAGAVGRSSMTREDGTARRPNAGTWDYCRRAASPRPDPPRRCLPCPPRTGVFVKLHAGMGRGEPSPLWPSAGAAGLPVPAWRAGPAHHWTGGSRRQTGPVEACYAPVPRGAPGCSRGLRGVGCSSTNQWPRRRLERPGAWHRWASHRCAAHTTRATRHRLFPSEPQRKEQHEEP